MIFLPMENGAQVEDGIAEVDVPNDRVHEGIRLLHIERAGRDALVRKLVEHRLHRGDHPDDTIGLIHIEDRGRVAGSSVNRDDGPRDASISQVKSRVASWRWSCNAVRGVIRRVVDG